MLKHLSILFLASTIFIACGSSSNKTNVTITGKVTNGDNETVYLQKFVDSLNNFHIIDSAALNQGSFTFKTNVDSMEFLLIGHKTSAPIELIAQKGEKIELAYDITNLPQSIDISGSNQSILNTNNYKFVAEFEAVKKAFSEKLNTLDYSDSLGRQEILKEFEVERAQFQKEKALRFSENIGSPSIHVFLPYLNPENELKYFQDIEATFAQTLNNTIWHKSVKRKLEEVENYLLQRQRYEEQQKALAKLAPGNPAPEITLNDPSGNSRSLSDLKGKVVLIDFWASWCRPCRAENPNVVRLYNKYKNKGFDIFSVSLDQQADKWIAAIEQDGLVWENHVSDLLGWNTSVTSLYGFSGIPYTVLIDKQGNIIASKLRGPSLEAKLKEIFGS